MPQMSKYKSLAELMWAKIGLACKSVPSGDLADRKPFDNLLAANRVAALGILNGVTVVDTEITWLSEKLTWNQYFGFLTPFPGVNPRSSAAGVYHSLAELIWTKVEMEFRGDATELKKHRNFFQILRESNLATVKKKFPTSRSVEWQLYQSEVDLWAVFGGGSPFPGVEPYYAPSTDEKAIQESPKKLTSVPAVSSPSLMPIVRLPPSGSHTNGTGKKHAPVKLADDAPTKPTELFEKYKQIVDHTTAVTTHTLIPRISQGPSQQENVRPIRQPLVDVSKGARVSVTKENIYTNDIPTQSSLAKALGGLGKSKWA